MLHRNDFVFISWTGQWVLEIFAFLSGPRFTPQFIATVVGFTNLNQWNPKTWLNSGEILWNYFIQELDQSILHNFIKQQTIT